MAEVNNSLATQIKVPDFNLGNTLAQATAIQRGQQEIQHNQFLYDQGGGYTPSELQTKAATQQQHMENAGRIGSAYRANPTDSAWSAAVDEAERVGLIRGGSLEKAQYLALPPQKRDAVARALQQAGQPSQAAVEQTGVPSQNRAYGQRTGELQGGLAPAPDSGPPSPPGSPPKPTVSLSEKAAAAAAGGQADQAQLVQYRKEQETAGVTKATLQQLREEATRVRTGAGADKEQAARKWLVALGDTVPGLKGLADKYANSTAAFESLDKNAGIVAREAMKGVGGTAASELDAISRSLVSGATTNKGIDINTSQLIGLQNYQHARAGAAEQYYESGTLRGFVTQFNKNAGPAAWIYMALPSDERQRIRDSLNKTDDGKRVLASLGRQIGYIHQNKLDEGLE